MPESYALPGIGNIVAELNKFGVVIAHSLYYLIVAVIVSGKVRKHRIRSRFAGVIRGHYLKR